MKLKTLILLFLVTFQVDVSHAAHPATGHYSFMCGEFISIDDIKAGELHEYLVEEVPDYFSTVTTGSGEDRVALRRLVKAGHEVKFRMEANPLPALRVQFTGAGHLSWNGEISSTYRAQNPLRGVTGPHFVAMANPVAVLFSQDLNEISLCYDARGLRTMTMEKYLSKVHGPLDELLASMRERFLDDCETQLE